MQYLQVDSDIEEYAAQWAILLKIADWDIKFVAEEITPMNAMLFEPLGCRFDHTVSSHPMRRATVVLGVYPEKYSRDRRTAVVFASVCVWASALTDRLGIESSAKCQPLATLSVLLCEMHTVLKGSGVVFKGAQEVEETPISFESSLEEVRRNLREVFPDE